MKPIKPVRVIRSMKPQVASSESPSSNSDTPDARSNFDPRLLVDNKYVQAYQHYPLMDFFGLSQDERRDDKINEQLKDVYSWVSRRVPEVTPDIMRRVLGLLEREIGLPQWGNSRLANLHGYISIENRIDELEAEREQTYGK